jgi:hypothetical protein
MFRAARSLTCQRLVDRYEGIDELMPRQIGEAARPSFADWLIERVYLVEIKTPTDDDAYAIFEAMNDRGSLRLSKCLSLVLVFF